ncbi:tyrosine-type recombinase/integrase [Rhodovulum steppense]|uniref:Phage integrase family protein n=1 Tax=Rhodovulum steppense TaxID=540251 RepID=A0A4R1YUQ1_9RHOB|nr:tyrosine-type recombinase/integrase [Rhodovulum steppense]TCM84587.1 phage integrase family protein [Rhodovulum steppense]
MIHKIRHTTLVRGTYHYNRRVPDHAVEGFGSRYVRLPLSRDTEQAAMLAEGLSSALDGIWSSPSVRPVDVNKLLERVKPHTWDLASCLDEYLRLHSINEKPSRLAVDALIRVAGNKAIDTYTRRDARDLVSELRKHGNKTATVRRRIQSLHAIIEFGMVELEVDKRNPFSRLKIPQEGQDRHQRLPFSTEQISEIYAWAIQRNKDTSLILPVLGETGARLAEVVGLRWYDVCLHSATLTIAPHPLRRLKTHSSARVVPLVGAGAEALSILKARSDGSPYVFPRWKRDDHFAATHASNTLNKAIKQLAPGQTCHCFRHTMRDRLRSVEAPLDLIDQVGGWTTRLGTGATYGRGYSVAHMRTWMEKVAAIF